MTTLAGVDLGARKAAVAMFTLTASGELKLRHAISLFVHPANRGTELAMLCDMVQRATQGTSYVFIEEPLVGRGVKASLQIAQTAGALMAVLTTAGTHTELVNVSKWKKFVVNNGNASKDDIKMHLEVTYPTYAMACDDQDQRDAVCVGIYGADVVRRARGYRDASGISRILSGTEPEGA